MKINGHFQNRVLTTVTSLVLFAVAAKADVVFTPPASLAANNLYNLNLSLGLDFTVNEPGFVTSIGVYNPNFDGSGNPTSFGALQVPVAIYYVSGANAGQQVPGTFATFTGTDWSSVSGSAVLKPLQGGPVLLNPGTYSVVAANYGGGGVSYYMVPPVSSHDTASPIGFNTHGGALTIGNSRYVSGAGLNYPNPAPASWTDPTFGAGTFEFDLTPVPEPIHFALGGVGLLGLVYVGRCLHMRRARG